MAVDAVASVILEKLRDLLSEEPFTNNKVIGSQLQGMQVALENMRGFFIDAADKEAESSAEAIKKWTRDYLTNLYFVEDAVESFALSITRQRKRLGFLMNHALFLKNFTACQKLRCKLKEIQRTIEKLNVHTPAGLEDASLRSRSSQKQNSIDLDIDDIKSNSSCKNYAFKMRSISDASLFRDRYQQSKLMYNYSYDEEVLNIIGYEREVPELLNMLTKEKEGDDSPGDRIISIVGELGSGKTIIARAVYGNRAIKNHFIYLSWITISKELTTTDILLNLLKQGEKSLQQGDAINEDSLLHSLWQDLKGRRYLIVLDGVQSCDQWKSLESGFPDDKNGSKIILTTCDEKVAMFADPESPRHYLKKLGNQESWNLFLNKVGLEEGSEDSSGIKQRIIQVCSGLPLNIILLGSLLSTKKDKGINEWGSILDTRANWHTSDILMLSYNDLDPHLQLCLLYMMLFPREYDIPIRRLERLWLSEGFVERPEKNSEDGVFQEDVVRGYFDNLVKRSLILVSKLRSDGSPRKCRLLGALQDFLSAKARDISLFHVHQELACPEDIAGPFGKRRLVEYADAKHCKLTSPQYQHLRSYISFNFQKKDTPAKDVGNPLNVTGKGLGLLKVLDLEGVYKPKLPENLGNLYNLRYLGLRWTFLDKLPKSVGELLYLETLDLKHTYINRIPPSIWKLKHLRHLNLNEVHLDNNDMSLHLHSSLPKLLTLWGLSVDHKSPVKNGLSRLTHLRELGITFRFNDSNGPTQSTEDLADWISKLKNLQSLRLRSTDDSGWPANLSLKPFSNLNKLSHMNLFGKLQKLPDKNHFPPNIKVLTLSVSRLDQDPMPILGRLQSLTVLRLLANSYFGEKIVCPSGTFEGLQVLKLWMLNDLKKWELEEGAMEKLKELNIRCCSKLENIPSRLLQMRTFKDLILTNMPEKFKEDVERKNFCKVSITVKNYEFTPLPWEQDDDSPDEMASHINGNANGGA